MKILERPAPVPIPGTPTNPPPKAPTPVIGQPARPIQPPSYFRTYEQVKTAMFDLQKKYPDLVTVQDIGDSSEKLAGKADRDLFALRLSSPKGGAAADKPGVFWLGGEHAREIANPELLLRWAERTLAGYGTDAEATALLDGRRIDIVPMMNPDGHAVVERGYSQGSNADLMQRKNTSPPFGTDLNRNYDYKWGGPGASDNPRSDTYRGASAASEPEVQAVQKFVSETKPGMFIDWHSYSELVLFPWGHTREKAPDYAGLKAVAEKFATYNGYDPIQSIDLYPTSGSSKDWAYGRHRIPAFTLETGKNFHQSAQEFERVWGETSPVMSYSAKVADAPYERVKGPDALDVAVRDARLQGIVDDSKNGNQTIAGAEAILDPATPFGKGVAVSAADGAFDSVREAIALDVSKLPAKEGADLLWLRAKDAEGNWGPSTAAWLKQPASA